MGGGGGWRQTASKVSKGWQNTLPKTDLLGGIFYYIVVASRAQGGIVGHGLCYVLIFLTSDLHSNESYFYKYFSIILF